MNGIENIVKHIMTESVAECNAIAAEAVRECEKIRAEYSKTEQEEYWNAVNAGAKETERRLDRLTSLAALESKKHILATQQEMLAQAFELAANKLLSLPEEQYVTFLSRLACEASMTGTETVYLSKKDKERCGVSVLENANAALKAAGKTGALVLSEKPAEIRGGLILSGGNIEVNCSVDALVAQYKNELSPKVSESLFN